MKWIPGATTGVVVMGGNGAGSLDNQLYYPNDVAIDSKGNIYAVDDRNQRVTKRQLAPEILIKNGDYEYPITLQLIEDGRKNKVLNKKINASIKVTVIHGQKDEVVPIKYSREVLKIFSKAKKKLNIIKKGDHSLSSKKNLNIICKDIDNIIKNTN